MSIASNEPPDSASGLATGESVAGTAPAGLFVRKSSGLVRELGIRDAFAFNISNVNPTSIGYFFFIILAVFPGTDLTWPVVISFFGSLLLVLMYSQLVASMPRTGGDYVYVSRILTPALGAAVGMAFLVAVFITSPANNLNVLVSSYIAFISATLGDVFHSHALTTFAGTLTEKGWTLGISAVVCGLLGWLMLKRVSLLAKVTYWLAVLGMLSVVVLIVEFLFHSPATFRHAFDAQAHNPHAYQQLIAAAHKSGVVTGVHSSAVASSVALVFGLYVGVTFSNYTGGELRKPGWTYRAASVLGMVVSLALYLVAWLALKHVAGLAFSQSAAALSANDPSTYGKLAGNLTAYVPSFALLIASNPVSKIVIAVGFASGVLSIIVASSLVLSRLLFALSFDRILPASVSNVRPKSHAPANAAVIVAVLCYLGTIAVLYTSLLQAARNLFLVVLGIFAISSFAATILPWRRCDLYNASPKMLGDRFLGVPVITIVGGMSCLFWLIALYLGATKSQVSGGYDTTSIVTLVGTCVIGAIAYGISRVSLSRKGANLELALHELPPE